jgi:hypothetical protein
MDSKKRKRMRVRDGENYGMSVPEKCGPGLPDTIEEREVLHSA